jgi:hypothetical protein
MVADDEVSFVSEAKFFIFWFMPSFCEDGGAWNCFPGRRMAGYFSYEKPV